VKDVGPAGLSGVITVGASGPDDAVAAFSNTGAEIDLVAPGVDIVSLRARRTDVSLVAGLEGYTAGAAFVGPDAHYYRVSGTSFAAPFVSGAAALLLAKDPSLTPEQVKRVLLQSAKETGAPGIDVKAGYGRLDLKTALAADPNAFVDARIEKVGVLKKDDGQVVVVTGTADADAFGKAEVELGAGDDPKSWKTVATLPAGVTSGVLAEIPVESLAGEKLWTLRVRTKHQNGREREARFRLNVGG
jgi:subtilisin family serine protease